VHAARAAAAAAAQSGIPAKYYQSAMRGSSWRKVWEALRDMGAEVPDPREFTEEQLRQAAEAEARITTTVDIRTVLPRKRDALMAHASQIEDSWFSKLPPEIAESAFGQENFVLVTDTTGAPIPETDLFAGLR
jgi:LmbE family N-acetylglucosaminyl deacetylase